MRVGSAGGAPQLVIAGHPDDARETRDELRQREAQMLGGFPDVAGDDQPVVGVRAHRGECLAIHAMADVEIADREQTHRPGGLSVYDSGLIR